MQTVQQILGAKPDFLASIPPSATVFEALTLMAQHDVGALLVLEGGQLAGIFSERDYARKVILQGKSSRHIPVVDIMTADVVSVRPEQTVRECMALMTDHRIRHLPVQNETGVLGIVSIGDIVKALLSEQEFVIKQLEHYITG
jgi:CBS domain-containing protein